LLKPYNVVAVAPQREGPTLQGLGIEPTAIAVEVPLYLWRFRKTGQFRYARHENSETPGVRGQMSDVRDQKSA
jgi:NADH dehydrogenase